jgi:hypothetical protein
MPTRKKIPTDVETQVLVLSRRRCALCFAIDSVQDEKRGQIAHIDQDPTNNSLPNLVFLCLSHHDAYDSSTSQSKGYTPDELKHYRDELYSTFRPKQLVSRDTRRSTHHKKRYFSEDNLKYVWDDAFFLVAAGLVPEKDIIPEILALYAPEYELRTIRPIVTIMVNGLLEQHKKSQASWPQVTDCDRLDAAFAELESNGIVCRQDFADCLSCGYAEIWGELKKEKRAGKTIRGFTFFHQQDTEHAVLHGGIHLGYGSLVDDEKADLAIAGEVAETLRRHGLRVNWAANIKQRIEVELDWKRRR